MRQIKNRSVIFVILLMLFGATLTGCGSRQKDAADAGSAGAGGIDVGQADIGELDADGVNVGDADVDGPESEGTDEGAADIGQVETGGVVRVGSLKGPTSMGLLFLMKDAEQEKTKNTYEFQMAVGADELLPLMVKGELDIALVPANVAGVLYQKTKGEISVININTLGVLYMISGDNSIVEVGDLKGRTVYLTGKGTTPDYVLQYILSQNGFQEGDCRLEYKSEATEVAALLSEKPEAIGLLPQPFAEAACEKNPALFAVLDMNEEWDRVQGENGSRMVTGVTVVRNDFLKNHEEAVRIFLKEQKASAEAINEDPATGAAYVAEAGIVANEQIALKAIPNCNITCIQGEEMKQALSGYLQVLYGLSPEAVGGSLPVEDFYYVP